MFDMFDCLLQIGFYGSVYVHRQRLCSLQPSVFFASVMVSQGPKGLDWEQC